MGLSLLGRSWALMVLLTNFFSSCIAFCKSLPVSDTSLYILTLSCAQVLSGFARLSSIQSRGGRCGLPMIEGKKTFIQCLFMFIRGSTLLPKGLNKFRWKSLRGTMIAGIVDYHDSCPGSEFEPWMTCVGRKLKATAAEAGNELRAPW